MEKRKLIWFAVFKNQMMGQWIPARDWDDLMSRMTKRQRRYWSNVQYVDSENRTINIIREFIDEQGMSYEDCVADYISHCQADFQDSICALDKFGNDRSFHHL